MRDATVAQFRAIIRTHRKEEIQNAKAAGRSLADLMLNNHVTITGIDDVQLKRYRRRYAVPESLKAIMYAVATAKLKQEMVEIRLNKKFDSYTLASGKIMKVNRCEICSKRVCRCMVANARS